jgi:hypothetical protein
MIPPLDITTGYLPPGIHVAGWEEVSIRFGNSPYRATLTRGLQRGLGILRDAGCRAVLLDGSYISGKDLPGDYDVAYEILGMDPNLLDPVFFDFRNLRAAMKIKFGGEYFPAHLPAAAGITYREYFATDKHGVPKGLIQIDPASVP